jgi:predicted RNA-binding Zn-ribbon protein involved in translation (DUF1610 family)
MEEKVKKVRKVFTDHLPRWGEGRYEGKIDWNETAELKYKVKGIYDNIEFEAEIVRYEAKGQYIYLNCNSHINFKMTTGDLQNCRFAKLLSIDKRTHEFIFNIGQNFNSIKRDLNIIDKEYRIAESNNQNMKWYKYKCNKCGYKGWIIESNLNIGKGCSVCSSAPKKVEEHINSIVANEETHWMIPYFQGGYEEAKEFAPQSNKQVYLKCPDCGIVKNKPVSINNLYANHSIGCPCSDGLSYPEKFMYYFFEELDVEFKTQLSKVDFKWCDNIRYDFYILKINGILEAHGEQHYIEKTSFPHTLQEEVENDKFKKELALANGIDEENYIIIDCRKSELEWIKNKIIRSRLNYLFDLSKVDWLKIGEMACVNLVKVACEHKRINPNLFASDISIIMKLSSVTIIKYLKKGNSLGWCYYNAKEEIARGQLKSVKIMNQKWSKQVEMFKNGISLGIFFSATELEKESEILFGVKLNHKNISAVCLKKVKTHQGFTFRYTEQLNPVIS